MRHAQVHIFGIVLVVLAAKDALAITYTQLALWLVHGHELYINELVRMGVVGGTMAAAGAVYCCAHRALNLIVCVLPDGEKVFHDRRHGDGARQRSLL